MRPFAGVLVVVAAATLACGLDGDTDPAEAVVEAEGPSEAVPDQEAPVIPKSEPEGRSLPLAVGHTWTYEVRERRGAGARIFLIPTKKAEERKLADWSLAVVGSDGDAFTAKLTRTPVGDDLPSTTEMRLWERDGAVWMDAGKGERPALELVLPPSPVSSERVRCVAHVLGGVVGVCPPVAGGPLGTAPGLEHGVVAEDLRPGAEVGQFLVGIVSVGLFIPGNRSSVQTATLTGFTPGPGTEAAYAAAGAPLVSAFRAEGARVSRLPSLIAKHGVDAEQGAAVVRLVDGGDVVAAARVVLPALPEDRRYAVVRTGVPLAFEDGGSGAALAKLRGLLPAEIPEEQRDGILGALDEDADRGVAAIVLSGDNPVFNAVLADAAGPFDDDRYDALEDALAVHPVSASGARDVVGLFAFDGGRRRAIERILPGIPESDRARALASMYEELGFDEARLGLLRDHADLLKSLPESERSTLADGAVFHREEAAEILGL